MSQPTPCHRLRYRFPRLLTALLVAAVLGLGGCLPGKTAPPGPSSGGNPSAGEDPAQPDPAQPRPQPGPFDILITGAMVYDGTGAPPRRADVGVKGDRIAAVGDLSGAQAARRIDAEGLALAPGFIDLHAHTYEYDDADGVAALMQGVTTQFGGVDGRHHGYLGQARPESIAAALRWIEERGTGVNQGLFAGLETLRRQVGAQGRPATPAEIEKMQELLRQALAEGAFGLSSGLEYEIGGLHAPTEEIIAVARAMAPDRGVYATHIRHERSDVRAGVEEALRIGREAGVPVAIQHFKFVGPRQWAQFEAVMAALDQAHAAGQSLTVDVYSYLTPDYGMHLPLEEAWATAGDPEIIVLERKVPAELQGKTLAEAAALRGVAPADLAAELVRGGAIATVEWIRLEHLGEILRRPYTLTSSDGEARALLPPDQVFQRGVGVHPRSYGNYPRLLRLNREHGWLPLEALIRKMTGAAADFYRIPDRGYIREGAYADLVVFDPRTVAEGATWWEPQAYPVGIHYVLVNGQVAVDGGKPTGVKAGRALRRQP
ncbi:MAG: amidohydrolase family protein [Bacillota bacterium]